MSHLAPEQQVFVQPQTRNVAWSAHGAEAYFWD
jgi:hypothetical protein